MMQGLKKFWRWLEGEELEDWQKGYNPPPVKRVKLPERVPPGPPPKKYGCPMSRMSDEELRAHLWKLREYRCYFQSTIDVGASIVDVREEMARRVGKTTE